MREKLQNLLDLNGFCAGVSGPKHCEGIHQGVHDRSPVGGGLWRHPRVSDDHVKVHDNAALLVLNAQKLKPLCLQDYSHLPGSPPLQRDPVRHAGRGADRRLCEVFSQRWQRDQPDETGLRGRAEVLRLPALGLPQDRGQPAGDRHARFTKHRLKVVFILA